MKIWHWFWNGERKSEHWMLALTRCLLAFVLFIIVMQPFIYYVFPAITSFVGSALTQMADVSRQYDGLFH